jgi:hypothetical protein
MQPGQEAASQVKPVVMKAGFMFVQSTCQQLLAALPIPLATPRENLVPFFCSTTSLSYAQFGFQ